MFSSVSAIAENHSDNIERFSAVAEESVWFPGYFEQVFKDKEHLTFLGYHENLGPIAISLMTVADQTSTARSNIRALVRSDLGFHVVEMSVDGRRSVSSVKTRQRTSSVAAMTLKKLKGALTVNGHAESYLSQLDISSQVLLEKVIFQYVLNLRHIHLNDSHQDPKIFDDLHYDLNIKIGKSLQVWGSIRTEDFFRTINPVDIAMSLEEAPTASLFSKLVDLEKQHSSQRHLIDIIRCPDIDDKEWGSVLSQSGREQINDDCLVETYEKPASSAKGDLLKRKHCIMDLLEKEKMYLSNLELTDTHLLQPLAKSSLLSKRDKSMMPKLKEILNVHKEFVLLLEHAVNNDNIGRSLLSFPNKFNCYASYVKSHEEKSQHFKQLLQTDEKFKQFVNEVKSKYIPNRLGFDDIFISPVQKVPRYGLIFKDLVKFTPNDHPDFKYLQDCIPVYAKVAMFLNEGIRKEKSQVSILSLVSQIENCPHDFAKPHRYIVKDFEITEVGKDERKFKLHVCNDCVLLSRVKNDGLKFTNLFEYSNLDVAHTAENEFELHFDIPQEKRSSIRLGDPIMNRGHARSSSMASLSLGSVFTGKSDHPDMQDFVFHRFKSLKSDEIVKSIHSFKYAAIISLDTSARKFLRELDVNNDILCQVFENPQDHQNQVTNNYLAIFITRDQTREVHGDNSRLTCFYNPIQQRLKIGNVIFAQELDMKASFERLSKLSMILNNDTKLTTVELLQHHLSKIVFTYASKSTLTRQPSQNPLHVKFADKSKRERRPSVADIFANLSPSKSPSPTKMLHENEVSVGRSRSQTISNRIWNAFTLKSDDTPTRLHFIVDTMCTHLESMFEAESLYGETIDLHVVEKLMMHFKNNTLKSAVLSSYTPNTIGSALQKFVDENNESIMAEKGKCFQRLILHLQLYIQSRPMPKLNRWIEILAKNNLDEFRRLIQIGSVRSRSASPAKFPEDTLLRKNSIEARPISALSGKIKGNESQTSIDDSKYSIGSVTELTRDSSVASLAQANTPRLVPRKPIKPRPLHQSLFTDSNSKIDDSSDMKPKRGISLPVIFNEFMAKFHAPTSSDTKQPENKDLIEELKGKQTIMKTVGVNTETLYTVDKEVERLTERIQYLERENYSQKQREHIYLRKFKEHGINLIQEYENM